MEYNVSEIEIKRITPYETKKDGTPLTTKAGKPYKKVLIDVDRDCIEDGEFEGKLSMLDFDNTTDNWTVGFGITGKIIHDGSYWNFELPRTDKRPDYKDLERRIRALEEKAGIVTPRAEAWNTMKEITTPKDALDFSKKVLEPVKEEDLGDDLPF
jgi:hypothetical protein